MYQGFQLYSKFLVLVFFDTFQIAYHLIFIVIYMSEEQRTTSAMPAVANSHAGCTRTVRNNGPANCALRLPLR